jgi:enoyl-CoA hydratase/carnithine racemase
MSATLLINREDRVLRLTLNRPEKRNALNLSLCGALAGALEEAEGDKRIGAILLQAAGKAFCAGMDLSEALSLGVAGQSEVHERLFTAGARILKPIVAAVQGPALGGGFGVVANAHVVVASEDATFGLTEIRVGLWPFAIYRAVTLAIGERRALELSLTGRIVGAREALALGLVHYVVPAAELDMHAGRIASALAVSSPEVARSGLQFVREARGLSWEEAGKLAAQFRARAFESADFREGVSAFREKRPPRWPSLD